MFMLRPFIRCSFVTSFTDEVVCVVACSCPVDVVRTPAPPRYTHIDDVITEIDDVIAFERQLSADSQHVAEPVAYNHHHL